MSKSIQFLTKMQSSRLAEKGNLIVVLTGKNIVKNKPLREDRS
jgi:hypothetical protein